jgi:2-polyprenyl-3-methyl-5-hydroxy-6-metoxy-1,4-benzoquinol methylase
MSAPEDAYGTQKRLAFAAQLIGAALPRRVLDFGCGIGLQLTLPLARAWPGVHFLGVDSDAASIAFANAQSPPPNLEYAPVAALPAGARYDLIIASEVIEHVDQPGALLRTLVERLEPNGRILLTVPNGYGPFELAAFTREMLETAGMLAFLRRIKRRVLGESRRAAQDTHAVSPHINFFSLPELRAAIAGAGLKVVVFRPRTLLCGFGFDLLVRGSRLTGWNAALADRLPAVLASDWMFVLERAAVTPDGWEYVPGAYARLRRAMAPLAPGERRAWIAHAAMRRVRLAWWRGRDAWLPTFARLRGGATLARGLFSPPPACDAEQMHGLAAQYLEHRFDLLGSGWTQVAHGKACRGLHGIRFPAGPVVQPNAAGDWLAGRINAANLSESRRLWRMVSPGYRPIDWQLDFKSGFRWSESVPAQRIRFGDVLGADVKVPWELGRLQHLPHLAQAYALERKEAYLREFRDQALDFIACNPPRFGVQWASSMDVAIRAANLLVARDLFLDAGAPFDAGFEAVLERSIREHAAFVAAMLDWHPRYRGNHYLCGVAGLVFAASYLRFAPDRRRALAKLQTEAQRQFLPDGGSFEASTGYHRLSGEALLQASLLAADELPSTHFDLLARIAGFAAETARPDGLSPQIGDQDSGRFLKLPVRCHALTVREAKARYANLEGYAELPEDAWYWDEELRDHSPLARVARSAPENVLMGELDDALISRLRALPVDNQCRYEFQFGAAQRSASAFPDFGLYVIRAGRSYVCIRCGPIGLNGRGAHAHNDALSIELVSEGMDVVCDPGSYLYTPLPAQRDRYRSVGAHFAPRMAGREPASLGPGLFRLGDEAQARCLYFDADGFLGMHRGYGAPVYRQLSFVDQTLVIEDFSEAGALAPFQPVPLSPKYGAVLR